MIQMAQAPNTRRATLHERQQIQLEETVRRRLRQSSYVQLRDIVCQCIAGTAVLTGQVSSFYLKQIAQTVVRCIDGVEQIDNQLEVIERPQPVSVSRFVSHQGG